MKLTISIWVVALIAACAGGALELTTMGTYSLPVLGCYTIALTALA